MAYPTLFLRREPARDGTPRKYDVVAFDEVNGKPDLSHEKARWSWSASSKPHRGRKYVMLNCYRWNIKWLDHMGNPIDLDAEKKLKEQKARRLNWLDFLRKTAMNTDLSSGTFKLTLKKFYEEENEEQK